MPSQQLGSDWRSSQATFTWLEQKRSSWISSTWHPVTSLASLQPLPCSHLRTCACRILLEFFAASDVGVFSPRALAAMEMREAISLETWKKNFKRLTTLAEFHKWLYKTHQCYAVQRQHEFSYSDLDEHNRKSY